MGGVLKGLESLAVNGRMSEFLACVGSDQVFMNRHKILFGSGIYSLSRHFFNFRDRRLVPFPDSFLAFDEMSLHVGGEVEVVPESFPKAEWVRAYELLSLRFSFLRSPPVVFSSKAFKQLV